MPDAVLLVSDLAADRSPTRCVWTGEPTSSATHLWALASPRADRVIALSGVVGVLVWRALGRKAMRVPIAVSAGPYGFWRRRAMTWAGLTCFGLGFVAVSPFEGGAPLAVFGLVLVVVSALLRARAHSGFWVSAELRPAEGHVVIHRAHADFDDQARDLFLRNLRR
ncbi:MAG: hypothetical protein QOD30_210 [Actinomycetota bacterium]|nr:hypothetical protein [Actinomycetota bacterium]